MWTRRSRSRWANSAYFPNTCFDYKEAKLSYAAYPFTLIFRVTEYVADLKIPSHFGDLLRKHAHTKKDRQLPQIFYPVYPEANRHSLLGILLDISCWKVLRIDKFA